MENKQVKILVLGGKGGSVTEGLLKCMRLAGYQDITLIDYDAHSAHFYRVSNSSIIKNTPDHGRDFIDELLNICRDLGIKAILAGSSWESKILSKYFDSFKAIGVLPLVNNLNLIEVGDDKWKTYEFLTENNFGTPITFRDYESAMNHFQSDAKLVVKPRKGRGSKDVFISNDSKELLAIVNYFTVKNIDFIIQEHISSSNEEYTVGIINDSKGKLIQSIVMKRELLGGATGYAEVCEPGFINEFCESVALKLGSTGPMNIQLRLDKNDLPLIFEINPRFSGSSIMRALAGFNEPDMILRNFVMNEDLSPVEVQYGNRYYRVFQEIEITPGSSSGQILNLL